MYILYFFVLYVALTYVGLRLVVPNFGFKKSALQKEIPTELEQKIAEYNQTAEDDGAFLMLAYGYVTYKHFGSRVKTVTQFWRAFGNVLEASPGFMQCTGQNYLLRTMLIKSGRFTESDIRVIVVPYNFFIHQYLQIKVGNEWINADPWSHFLGIPLGGRSFLFG